MLGKKGILPISILPVSIIVTLLLWFIFISAIYAACFTSTQNERVIEMTEILIEIWLMLYVYTLRNSFVLIYRTRLVSYIVEYKMKIICLNILICIEHNMQRHDLQTWVLWFVWTTQGDLIILFVSEWKGSKDQEKTPSELVYW